MSQHGQHPPPAAAALESDAAQHQQPGPIHPGVHSAETATKPSAKTTAKNNESDSSEGVGGGFAPGKDRSGTDATGSQTQSSGSRNQSTGDSAQGSSTSADSNDEERRNNSSDAAPNSTTNAATTSDNNAHTNSNSAPSNSTTNNNKAHRHRPNPAPQECPGAPEAGSNLFVAGLPSTVDDAVLASAFSPHGSVVSAKVMLHVETAVSRGFGFVLFPTAAEAEHAREVMQGMAIDGHGGRLQITVSKHRGENVTAESRVVYVRHVPSTLVGSADLTHFMGTFGTVVKLVTRSAEQAASSGEERLCNIIVTFDSVEAARECVAACHGKTPLAQCQIPLLSKMEEPQTLREQRLREQRMAQNQRAADVPVADASMLVATVKLPHVQTPQVQGGSAGPGASQHGSAHRAGVRTPSGSSAASTSGRSSHNRGATAQQYQHANHTNNTHATNSHHHHQHQQLPQQQHEHQPGAPQQGGPDASNMSAQHTALAPPLMPPFGFPGMYGMMPPMPPPPSFAPPPFGPYSMPPTQTPTTTTPGPQQDSSRMSHGGLLPFPAQLNAATAMGYGGMPPYMPPPFNANTGNATTNGHRGGTSHSDGSNVDAYRAGGAMMPGFLPLR